MAIYLITNDSSPTYEQENKLINFLILCASSFYHIHNNESDFIWLKDEVFLNRN